MESAEDARRRERTFVRPRRPVVPADGGRRERGWLTVRREGSRLFGPPASLEASRSNRTRMSPARRMLAGLRAHERSGEAGFLHSTASRSLVVRASALRGARSRLPLRGSPGCSPGSLFSPWIRAHEHQHEPQHIGVVFRSSTTSCASDQCPGAGFMERRSESSIVGGQLGRFDRSASLQSSRRWSRSRRSRPLAPKRLNGGGCPAMNATPRAWSRSTIRRYGRSRRDESSLIDRLHA